MGWTRENLKHAASLLKQGANPAATVYGSIGADFPLALAPGWLNLGLWEGAGDGDSDAAAAVRRLVERLAADLPADGVILDVGNGLGKQDVVVARVARPRRLVALNITELQLSLGLAELEEAGADAVCGDACRIPLGRDSVDGVLSVEAAFHFSSRAAFLREAARVLKPGGVIAMSDVPVERLPRGPREGVAALGQLRLWGMRSSAAQSSQQIAALAEEAGFQQVRVELCGERVIDPALRFVRRRLAGAGGLTGLQKAGVRVALTHVELLRERGIIDYMLLSARVAT